LVLHCAMTFDYGSRFLPTKAQLVVWTLYSNTLQLVKAYIKMKCSRNVYFE
jgi:hypothetical protein